MAPLAPHLAREPVDRRTGTSGDEPNLAYIGFPLSNHVKRHIYDHQTGIVIERDVHPTA